MKRYKGRTVICRCDVGSETPLLEIGRESLIGMSHEILINQDLIIPQRENTAHLVQNAVFFLLY
jgi:hypothetical protein